MQLYMEHTQNMYSPRKGFRDYTYSHECLMAPPILLSGATQQALESSGTGPTHRQTASPEKT